MSINPFAADSRIRERHQQLAADCGEAIGRDILAAADAHRDPAENLGGIVLAADVERIMSTYGLNNVEELMRLAQPAARRLAKPPISEFFVGAVGLERGTGNLILGGNVEFPGTHLGFTIHGEGFVFARAFSRGTGVEKLALGEAHPCAHCRQFISEFADSGDLTLIDTIGHRLTLAQLYPWPFDPGYLGERGFVPGTTDPTLELDANALPEAIAAKLLESGRRAHAPYSRCPGAVVLQLRDGGLVTGASIESVAFNPTMGPLQAALIDLLAHGYSADDVVGATLGTRVGGAVDYSTSVRELLTALAPGVPLVVVSWRGLEA